MLVASTRGMSVSELDKVSVWGMDKATEAAVSKQTKLNNIVSVFGLEFLPLMNYLVCISCPATQFCLAINECSNYGSEENRSTGDRPGNLDSFWRSSIISERAKLKNKNPNIAGQTNGGRTTFIAINYSTTISAGIFDHSPRSL